MYIIYSENKKKKRKLIFINKLEIVYVNMI